VQHVEIGADGRDAEATHLSGDDLADVLAAELGEFVGAEGGDPGAPQHLAVVLLGAVLQTVHVAVEPGLGARRESLPRLRILACC
jgi:hypothetical protein